MNYLKWFSQFIKTFFSRKKRYSDKQEKKQSDNDSVNSNELKKIEYITEFIDDLPEINDLKEKTIYIVGENGYTWLAAFKCPCGCNEIIQLNLLPDTNPRWRINYYGVKAISIYPSIERKVGCKSHFIVRNGNIDWWESFL